MAIESVRCASGLSEPSDIAVTTNRLTIDSTGSTSSKGTGSPSGSTRIRSRTEVGACWAT